MDDTIPKDLTNSAVHREEFERFLGEKSKELAERLEEAKEVMKRLKERE